MKNNFALLILVALSAIPSIAVSSVTHRSCSDTLTLSDSPFSHEEFSAPGPNEILTAISSRSVSFPKFAELFFPIAKSSQQLQVKWLPTSQEQVIWATHKGHLAHKSMTTWSFLAEPAVWFTFKKGSYFFDVKVPAHRIAWEEWVQAGNISRTNRFPKAQVNVLESNGLPSHSAFYDDFHLVGMRQDNDPSGTRAVGEFADSRFFWKIINFDLVQSMDLTVPEDVPLLLGMTERRFHFEVGP